MTRDPVAHDSTEPPGLDDTIEQLVPTDSARARAHAIGLQTTRREPDGASGDADPREGSSADALVGRFEAARLKNRVFGRLFNKQARLRIGRYDILGNLGHGGMGVVYAAYDDELDRKIALKLIQGADVESEMVRLRFKREAQAMAKLSHPNIVTVHEVGEADGKIYIAMEFIRGESLEGWCDGARDWAEVVEVFIQAGRGLAAAHDAGLVHRDLKPHNIMRGRDGVVKVLDFGLARVADNETLDEGDVEAPPGERPSSNSVLQTELTRAGALLGTPAYMAPEVFANRHADARSDQFSFCVSLYQALYGQLPFDGATLEALIANVGQRSVRAPPAGSRVPGWVHRVVTRGLDPQPERRWPSMRALVDALSRDPGRQRRRLLVGLALAGLTGAGGFAIAELRATPVPGCERASTELFAVWSPARRARLAAVFEGSEHRLAAGARARVLPALDQYAARWSAMREEACQTHRAGQHSDRMFDLRAACLDRRRAGLNTLLDALERRDDAVIQEAAWATARLASIEDCADLQALTAAVPPPKDPAIAREVRTQRELLAGVDSLIGVGRYADAIERATQTLARAEALDYEPLIAEALLELGAAQLEGHEPEPALASLSRGVTAAIRSGQDAVAAEALARRMWILADPLGRPEAALRDAPEAEAFIDKLGGPAALRWLQLNNHGVALYRSGDAVAAERSYRAALGVLAADARAFPVETVSTQANLASLLYERGHLRAATEELRAVSERTRALIGEAHPRSAMISSLLAMCLYELGRRREALALFEDGLARLEPDDRYGRVFLLEWVARIRLYTRQHADARALAESVLAIAEESFPDDPLRTAGLQLRGLARVGGDAIEPGLADLRAAIELERARVGPEGKAVADARWLLGAGLVTAYRYADAAAELERASEIYAGLGDHAPPQLGRILPRLAEALLRQRALTRAEEVLARARAAQDEAGFRDDNEHRMVALKVAAELAVARGRLDAARADYARACGVFASTHDADDPMLADCRLAWARALEPGPSARALAQQARDAYQSLGSGFDEERADAEALLAR